MPYSAKNKAGKENDMKYIIERISIRPERNILYFIYSEYGEKPKKLKTFEMEGKTFTEKVGHLIQLVLEEKLVMGSFQKNVVKFFNIIDKITSRKGKQENFSDEKTVLNFSIKFITLWQKPSGSKKYLVIKKNDGRIFVKTGKYMPYEQKFRSTGLATRTGLERRYGTGAGKFVWNIFEAELICSILNSEEDCYMIEKI